MMDTTLTTDTDTTAQTVIIDAQTEQSETVNSHDTEQTETEQTTQQGTQNIINNLLYEEAQDKARAAAVKLSRVTWITEMIVSRITDLSYDIRALTADFSDVELEYSVQQVGTVAVYSLKHFGHHKDTKKEGVTRISSVWAVEPEVYYQGTHENGDPVKRMRYTARQLTTLDRKALLMSSNAGVIKALESIQRKAAKGKGLTAFEVDLRDSLTERGYNLADLLAERARAVGQFDLTDNKLAQQDTTPRVKA